MAVLSFKDINIIGLSACVPANTIVNRKYTKNFSPEEASLIVEKTGIEERRFALQGTTASDLCFFAAEQLLSELEIARSEIDVLIFVSQTADFRMPATSIILQDSLPPIAGPLSPLPII